MSNLNQLDIEDSKETLEILYEMSQILNCGLSRETLSILVAMIEKGVNPEALINVVKEMKNENYNMSYNNNNSNNNSNISNINNN